MATATDTITFVVRDRTAKVPAEAALNSEFIKEQVLFGIEQPIVVPDKYYRVIGNYINFLQGKPTVTTTATKLAKCFDMESFFADNHYLHYLLRQLFENWSVFGSTVVNSILGPDIQYDIFQWCPYDFVPKQYMERTAFFERWFNNVQNSEIAVDYDKVYYTNAYYYDNGNLDELDMFHTENGLKLGLETNLFFKPNGDYDYQSVYFNGVLESGIEKTKYPSGLIKEQVSVKDGKLDGQQLTWYDDEAHQLETEEFYVNGKREGKSISYYTGGSVRKIVNYQNGKKNGKVESFSVLIPNVVIEEEYYTNGILDYSRFSDGRRLL
jgi:antitoxin component YwqK of YwqJK toxin-antitoxin module